MTSTKSSKPTFGLSKPRLESKPLKGRSLGPLVAALAEQINLPLMDWQKYALEQASLIDDSGNWIRSTCGVIVARQNGKSHLARMRILAGLYVFGEAEIAGMAQNRTFAVDTLQKVVDYADGTPELRRRIKRVSRTNGNEKVEVYCHHWPKDCPPGCARVRTYRVLAATPDNARGRSLDFVYVDELREINEATWAAIAPTTRARPNPQTWVTSNAGDATSTVLNDLRTRALADKSSRLGWWEWSADPVLKIGDRTAWAQANPSLGRMITAAALEDSLARDSEAQFRTESLCQWIDGADCPWNMRAFDHGLKPDLEPDPSLPTWAGVDFDFPRQEAYLVMVQVDGDSLNLFLYGWVSEQPLNEREVSGEIAKLARDFRIQGIAYDPRASGHLAPHLARIGVRMIGIPWAGVDFANSCDVMLSAINARRVQHKDQAELRQQLALSTRRAAGDGGWRITRKDSGSIPAAIAAVLAVGLADKPQSKVVAIAG